MLNELHIDTMKRLRISNNSHERKIDAMELKKSYNSIKKLTKTTRERYLLAMLYDEIIDNTIKATFGKGEGVD